MLRNIRLLHIHNFLTDFSPHWPFMVIYYADVSGSYTSAMSVLALETFAAAMFDIPAGIFSDKLGRRLTIACGSFACALGLTCYASAHGIGLLYIGAVLIGLCQCLFNGNNNALLYESLKSQGLEREYHHYRGSTGSMFQLALCLSAFLSMWLSEYGLRFVFVFAVLPQIAAVVVSLFFTEPRQHIDAPRKSLAILKQAYLKTFQNPKLLGLVTAKSINYGAGEANFQFAAAFVNSLWPTWAVGLYRGLNHALSFIGFRLAGRAIEKAGEPLVFVARDIYWFISQMLALALHSVISPVLFLTGSIFFGPGEVASDHLMQQEFTDDERATMGSVASFATSIVFSIVAVGIGALTDEFGMVTALAVAICLCFISMPINIWLFRKEFKLQFFK